MPEVKRVGIKKKAPKAQTIQRTSKAAKLIDERHIGRETTTWDNLLPGPQMNKLVQETLQHYNYFYDPKDARDWALSWVLAHRPKDHEIFEFAEWWKISIVLGGMCKIHMNGCNLSLDRVAWIHKKIDEVLSTTSAKIKEQVIIKTASQGISIIADIEGIVDLWLTDRDKAEEWSTYAELQKTSTSKVIAAAVHAYYTPIWAEVNELITLKSPDLVEGYRKHMPKVLDQKAYTLFLRNILGDCEKYITGIVAKRVQKPRAKKAVPAEKLVANMRYQPTSVEYKLTSVEPIAIIGASIVLLFNTKYRSLSIIVAEAGKTLSAKGMGITDFDPALSLKKTLRKPEEVFAELSKGTKARVPKYFDSIKTAPAPANGRLSDEILILKVFK